MYRYYLDNVLLDQEPSGWQDMTDHIQRVDEVKGLFVTVDLTLKLFGTGYDILFTSYGNSYCGSHDITIQESCDDGVSYTDIYHGIIFISDCVFDYNNCTVDAKVQDNSFYAKINNNKSIKTYVEVGKSKNGVVFTGGHNYRFYPFDPCTAAGVTWIATYQRHAVSVYECFRCLVAFMTDDTIDFDSSFFKPGGEADGFCITDGIHLSSTNVNEYSYIRNIRKMSFLDLFTEMNKKFNLGMMIDNSGTRPKLLIEKASYFKNSTSVLTMNNINGMKASVDIEHLYSQVHIGSDTFEGTGCAAGGLAFEEDTPFITYKDESYFVLGTCNIDNTLDLFSSWQIDSNKIQDCVVNGSELYDDDHFIIETTYNYPGISLCVQGDPFNFGSLTPPVDTRFYNPSLLNSAVCQNYFDSIPNSIAQTLADPNDECYINRTQTDTLAPAYGVPSTTYQPVVFNDKTTLPFNDPGGNFNLAAGRYTATTIGGIYRFECTFNMATYTSYGFNGVNITYTHYDSLGNVIGSPYTASNTFRSVYQNGQLFTVTAQSQMINMAIGDYINIKIIYNVSLQDGSNSLIVFGGIFKTVYTSNGGGNVIVYDPNKYPALKFEFNYPLSIEQWNLIRDQPNYTVSLNVDGKNNFKAFIQDALYKRKLAMGQFICIASKELDQ